MKYALLKRPMAYFNDNIVDGSGCGCVYPSPDITTNWDVKATHKRILTDDNRIWFDDDDVSSEVFVVAIDSQKGIQTSACVVLCLLTA